MNMAKRLHVSEFDLQDCDECLKQIKSLLKDISSKKKIAALAKESARPEVEVKRHYLVRIQEVLIYGW